MNRYLKNIIAAAAAITIALMVNASKLNAKNEGMVAYHPVISTVSGSVKIMGLKYSVWEPATVGSLLLSGDTVKTGWDSSVEIQFLSGKVRLYENSILIIPSIGAQDRKKDVQDMVVEEGDVLFDINPLGVQRQFEFRTKNVQGGVKGTVFMVSYVNDGTTVSVHEGTVWVSEVGWERGKVKVLKAGDAIRVGAADDLDDVRGFDPDYDIEDYSYNVPPGLDSQSRLPADYNANPDNNGVRERPDKIKKSPPGLYK